MTPNRSRAWPDGSTPQMEPDSPQQLLTVRPADRVLVFRLLVGSATGDVHGNDFEVQAHEEVAMNFNMVATEAPTAAAYTATATADRTTTANANQFKISD